MSDLNTMTRDELVALVAQLQQDKQRALSLKVTEKGAVGVYGLGQFPVSLYRSQWERLIPFVKSGAIDRFIEANAASLSVKPTKKAG